MLRLGWQPQALADLPASGVVPPLLPGLFAGRFGTRRGKEILEGIRCQELITYHPVRFQERGLRRKLSQSASTFDFGLDALIHTRSAAVRPSDA